MGSIGSGFRAWVALPLVAGLLATAPATSSAEAETVIKFALMIPRSPRTSLELKKRNKQLAELTGGKAKIRVYWGGAAGDERDVLRKMRNRQIDGSAFALPIMSEFVREALVLESPALFTTYKQLDEVRKQLTPQFDEEAYRNGFKVLVWGDIGRLRLFSKQKIESISDFKHVRPWLYSESEMLKEFYKLAGATGVPLGIAEVYGAMETGMIDTFWGTSLLAGALQWHRTAKYVSPPLGFLNGGLVYKRESWDEMPEIVRDAMVAMVKKEARRGQADIRKQDQQAHDKLLHRGYKELVPKNEQEWWDMGHKLRKRMIGRIYTKKLVEKTEQIAMKYAPPEQKARFANVH